MSSDYRTPAIALTSRSHYVERIVFMQREGLSIPQYNKHYFNLKNRKVQEPGPNDPIGEQRCATIYIEH
jgi:hypothetical protein